MKTISEYKDKYGITNDYPTGYVVIYILNAIVGFTRYGRKTITDSKLFIIDLSDNNNVVFTSQNLFDLNAIVEFIQKVELIHKLELLEV